MKKCCGIKGNMKTKNLFGILGLFLCASCFMSCLEEDEEGRKITDYKEYVLTVASEMKPGVIWSEGRDYLKEVYPVKKENAEEWEALGGIGGFEFEEGYEYRIKISETSYLDYSMGQPAWTEHELLEVTSKEKKVSEGLPKHFIPEAFYKDKFLPKYRYAVEADNKEVIEEDLKNNSILPLDYHYFYYAHSEGAKWMAVKDDTNVLGPGLIKRTNKTQEEFPEVYNILPPEGQVNGFMEWSFLDEDGNETSYPSFDVFYGDFEFNGDMMPTTFYLYKDLTAHYKSKYPDAGVKAVVVSYAIEIN